MTFVATIAFAAVVGAMPEADDRIGVKEAVDLWEAGAAMVSSYDLYITLTVESFLDPKGGDALLERSWTPVGPFYSHIYRSGDKRRGDFFGERGFGEGGPGLVLVGKDGVYQSDLGDHIIIYDDMLDFGLDQYEDYEVLYRAVAGTTSRIELTRLRDASIVPDDGPYIVLEAPPVHEGDFGSAGWKVWLDPDRNFLPIRIQQWVDQGGRVFKSLEYEITLDEVAPGVWAPVKGVIDVYYKTPTSPLFGKVATRCTLTVDRGKSHFITDVPDEIFDDRIEPGDTVIDQIRNITYVAGRSDPEQYLEELAQQGNASVEQLLASRSGDDPIVVPSHGWTAARLAGVGATLAALALVGVFVRRVARHRQEVR